MKLDELRALSDADGVEPSIGSSGEPLPGKKVSLESLRALSDAPATEPITSKSPMEQFKFSRDKRIAKNAENQQKVQEFKDSRDARDTRNGLLAFFDTASKTIDSFSTKPLTSFLNFPLNLAPEGHPARELMIPNPEEGGIEKLTKAVFKSDYLFESTPIPDEIPDSPFVSGMRDAGAVAATFLLTPFGANIKMLEGASTGANLKRIVEGFKSFSAGQFKTGVGELASGTAGLAVKGKEGVKGIAKDMGESIRDRPIATVLGEFAGATAGGYAGFSVAQTFPDSPVAKFTAEVSVGSFATAAAPRMGVKGYQSLMGYFRKNVDTDNVLVQKRLQRDLDETGTEGHDSVLEKLRAGESLTRLKGVATPSQTTGSHTIARIHQALVEQTDKLKHAQQVQFEEFNTALLESAKDGVAAPGKIEYTKQFLRDQQQGLSEALDQMVKNAKMITTQTIKDYQDKGIKLTLDDANKIAQEQLEFIRKAARAQEAQLYEAIPDSVKFNMAAPVEVLIKELSRRSRSSDPADIPSYVTQLIGKVVKLSAKEAKKTGKTHAFKSGTYKKTATAKELRHLRGRLIQDARQAAADNNGEKATFLNKLAEGIRLSLSEISDDASEEAVHAIKSANMFSTKFNDVFTRGHIAPLMKSVPEGGTKLQKDDFLDMGVKGAGRKKAKTIRAIIEQPKKLIEDEGVPLGKDADPNKLIGAVEDWIKGDFVKRFIEDNNFKHLTSQGSDTLEAAKRYLKANEDTFDMFPSVREDLQRMIDTGDASSVLTRRVEDLGSRLGNVNISKATMFIKQRTSDAFDSIKNLDGVNVDKQIQMLVNTVNKDSSGEALEGLQAALFNWVIERGKGTAVTINKKDLFLDGTLLTRAINDPATKVMLHRVLSKKQLDHLELIRDATERLSISRNAVPSKEGVTGDKLGSTLSTLVSVAGAQLGRKIAGVTGGGTVQTPGIMARRLRQLTENGVINPVMHILHATFMSKDSSHLIDLLKEIKSPEEFKRTALSLGIWLGHSVAELGSSYIPQDEQ